MHPLELHHLTTLMNEQMDTQREIRERSSTLWDGELTIDEALTQRIIIEQEEEYLIHLKKELIHLADQAFLGYTYPGGLTSFFYGYQATPPSAYAPGHYARD